MVDRWMRSGVVNINEFQGLALNWLALMVGVWVLVYVLCWFCKRWCD